MGEQILDITYGAGPRSVVVCGGGAMLSVLGLDLSASSTPWGVIGMQNKRLTSKLSKFFHRKSEFMLNLAFPRLFEKVLVRDRKIWVMYSTSPA